MSRMLGKNLFLTNIHNFLNCSLLKKKRNFPYSLIFGIGKWWILGIFQIDFMFFLLVYRWHYSLVLSIYFVRLRVPWKNPGSLIPTDKKDKLFFLIFLFKVRMFQHLTVYFIILNSKKIGSSTTETSIPTMMCDGHVRIFLDCKSVMRATIF